MARLPDFVRLPGRGGILYRQSLWLGPDHLLSVTNRGYSEDYKRFYYRDVRAIQIRLTTTYALFNTVLGAFAAICVAVQLLGPFVWKWDVGGQIAFGILTGLVVILFLINLIPGRTCAVHLYTAVHSEPLPSLSRLRSATRALSLLQARIESVQGRLTPEQAIENAGILEPSPGIFQIRAAPLTAAEEPVESYSGHFHWSLFALLLFNALLTVVGSFYRAASMQVLNTILYVGLCICMLGALIRQRRSRMGKGLRRLAWSSAFYVWFVSVLGSFVGFFLWFQKGMRVHQPGAWDMIRAMMETVPADHPVLLALAMISASLSLAIGLAGVVLMMQYRREAH